MATIDSPNMIFMGQVSDLDTYTNAVPGTVVCLQDTQELMIYTEDNIWQKLQIDNPALNMSLYEINKSVVGQLPTINDIYEYITPLNDYKNRFNDRHFMLLCKDYNYYTIFEKSNQLVSFGSVVIEIIENLGEVYSIEFKDDNAVEIWIKPEGEDNPLAFYLFPYEAGVVYYG